MPLLPEEKSHYINYDNIDINSSLLSKPIIRKKMVYWNVIIIKYLSKKAHFIQNYIQNQLF